MQVAQKAYARDLKARLIKISRPYGYNFYETGSIIHYPTSDSLSNLLSIFLLSFGSYGTNGKAQITAFEINCKGLICTVPFHA